MNKFWVVYMYPKPRGVTVPRRAFKNHHAVVAKAYEIAKKCPGKPVHIMELKDVINSTTEVTIHESVK